MLANTPFLDSQNWSPLVSIPNDENVSILGDNFTENFDIFGRDFDYQESPLKPSSKRPRLERAATTTGILADITASKFANALSSTPFLQSPFLEIPSFIPDAQASPKKAPTSMPLPDAHGLPNPTHTNARTGLTPRRTVGASGSYHAPAEDDIFHLLHSDESEPGIDLLQGFEKIGARASVAPNGSPSKGSRPGLGRSSTTLF
jgi:hypothetical protein